MNRPDTAALLAYAAAYDRRSIGDTDVEAWHDVLADIDAQDARAAVRAWYAANDGMIQPAAVREGVRALRADRLQRVDVEQLDPPSALNPDDAAAYRQWMLGALRATADGRPMPARPALGLRPVAQLVEAAAGRRTPAVDGPLSVDCPWCHARPGCPCTNHRGRPLRRTPMHSSRRDTFEGKPVSVIHTVDSAVDGAPPRWASLPDDPAELAPVLAEMHAAGGAQ